MMSEGIAPPLLVARGFLVAEYFLGKIVDIFAVLDPEDLEYG